MTTSAATVACNVYVTAAASHHSSTLLNLLNRTQCYCQEIRHTAMGTALTGSKKLAPVAVIHAYADIPYDRSSFHLAGRPDCVADVVGRLIRNALNEIDLDCNNINNNKTEKNTDARHPFVGLVDHVSIMPLNYPRSNNSKNCEAAANAAHEIGKQISKTNLVNIHYYGMACPHNTPLATVRRQRTSFFQSGGATGEGQVGQYEPETKRTNASSKGDMTIGAPVNFVENFNIRLTSNVNFEQAKTLTQFLRGRNISTKGYGVAGVEALTLPYVRDTSEGGTVYEVACNLTHPTEGCVNEVRAQLEKWIERQRQLFSSEIEDAAKLGDEYFVEDAYSVGTTEEQCVSVLSEKWSKEDIGAASNEVLWKEYDQRVYDKFRGYLQKQY